MRKLSSDARTQSEAQMEPSTLLSGRDTLLLVIPILVAVFFSIFGLDQIVAAPRTVQRRRLTGTDDRGEPILEDPDGRLSHSGRSARSRRVASPARTMECHVS